MIATKENCNELARTPKNRRHILKPSAFDNLAHSDTANQPSTQKDSEGAFSKLLLDSQTILAPTAPADDTNKLQAEAPSSLQTLEGLLTTDHLFGDLVGAKVAAARVAGPLHKRLIMGAATFVAVEKASNWLTEILSTHKE